MSATHRRGVPARRGRDRPRRPPPAAARRAAGRGRRHHPQHREVLMATVALKQYQHYIGGEWVDAADGATFESFNPATGEPWYTAARGSAEDMHRAVAAAEEGVRGPVVARSDADAARPPAAQARRSDRRERRASCAIAESTDNGKLIREMRVQLAVLPEYYYYFAGLADKIHGDVIPALRREILNYTLREPVGVVGAITPWNSPLLLTVDEARAGARRGQHDRHQAVGAHLGVAARADAAVRAGGLPAGRGQRRHRLRRRRRRRAGRPPGRREDRLHRAPAQTGRADRRAGRRPARPRARSSWAASRRSWCSTTPTRRAPRWASSPACSPPPARPAWRARACSCRRASTTRCSSWCWSARGGSGSATRSTPRPSSARWRSRISWRRCSRTSPSAATRTARRCCTAAASPMSRPPPAAGSTSRPSSPTRATTCGSARRRSSARSR